jgi:hypothetical protein
MIAPAPKRYAAMFKKGVRVVVHGKAGDTIYRVKDGPDGTLQWYRLVSGSNGKSNWVPDAPGHERVAARSSPGVRKTKPKPARNGVAKAANGRATMRVR